MKIDMTFKYVLVVCFYFTSVNSSEIYRCPSNLPRNQFLRTYRDQCYEFINVEKYWTSARDDCFIRGGRLVQIRDMPTQDFIYGSLRELQWNRNGVWIGAHDLDAEGLWKWVTGDPVVFTYWDSDQPGGCSFWFYCPEDCANMRLDSGGRWHDFPCQSLNYVYSYVCQYAMSPPTTTKSTTTTSTLIPTTTTPSTTTSSTTTSTSTTTSSTSTSPSTITPQQRTTSGRRSSTVYSTKTSKRGLSTSKEVSILSTKIKQTTKITSLTAKLTSATETTPSTQTSTTSNTAGNTGNQNGRNDSSQDSSKNAGLSIGVIVALTFFGGVLVSAIIRRNRKRKSLSLNVGFDNVGYTLPRPKRPCSTDSNEYTTVGDFRRDRRCEDQDIQDDTYINSVQQNNCERFSMHNGLYDEIIINTESSEGLIQ